MVYCNNTEFIQPTNKIKYQFWLFVVGKIKTLIKPKKILLFPIKNSTNSYGLISFSI